MFERAYRDGRVVTERPDDPRLINLATMLSSDIGGWGVPLLEALDLVERARAGHDSGEWTANATSARYRPDGVTVTDLGPKPQRVRYSLDEVHQALLEYWEFLFPESGGRRKAVEEWAYWYEREHPGADHPHPCLDHLPL
ncbi:hypothetical protein [Actinomadura parmotrematis]|uniref:Uncharacterized protein n=1 Tax=Actinomadura parmotrematis TaxID=2864039 RepID=A0ABS7FYN9_9ACTN|nr:hypothetical protein [Actinomadura parmotrematis]MBW8485555.1 hypothetical protein [Actinomadura parmotrematis]